MRHIFIVNPEAGKHKKYKKILVEIESYFASHGGSYEVIMTQHPGHGAEIAREQVRKGKEVRLYSVGGDGSLHDIVNGAYGYPNAEIGVIPCGSGNDFIAYFADTKSFSDIEGQIKGASIYIDLIKCEEEYSINQCCMGMDAEMAAKMHCFKRLPFVTDSFAYTLSAFYGLIRNIKNHFTVQIDDHPPVEKDFLFAIAANGSHCGGGYQSAPDAKINDGFLECVLVNSVSRLKAVRLFPQYRKGKHVNMPEICSVQKGSKITVYSDREAAVAMDGEIIRKKAVTLEIQERGVRFILPCYLAAKDEERRKKEMGVILSSASCDFKS